MGSLKNLCAVTAALFAAVVLSSGVRGGMITSVAADGADGLASGSGVNSDGSAWATVTASAGDGQAYQILGTVEGDPTLFVDQTIFNDTGVPWDQYTVTINPGPGSIVSSITPLAPAFFPDYLPVKQVIGNTIIYSGGLVPINVNFETRFTFDVTASGGAFSYGVGNEPHLVPEPASLGLLGLGGALLLRRKKHL